MEGGELGEDGREGAGGGGGGQGGIDVGPGAGAVEVDVHLVGVHGGDGEIGVGWGLRVFEGGGNFERVGSNTIHIQRYTLGAVGEVAVAAKREF